MQMTLDGFVARTDGTLDWMWEAFTPAVMADVIEETKRSSTQLMGRIAYEGQAAHWPNSAEEIAPLINEIEKIVFSSTLTEPLSWSNSRLATAGLAATVAELKTRPGGDIVVVGGAALARAAVREQLVDEYHLIVHPVAIGAGLPLFGSAAQLRLIDQHVYSSGAMRLIGAARTQ
jgi:dihydrofolate reductase